MMTTEAMNHEENPVRQCIAQLRSTHGDFAETGLEPATLRAILDSAVRSASASAQQAYAIIVLEKTEVIRALTGYAAPVALVFCADGHRQDCLARHLGYAVDERADLANLQTWWTDAILAAQTACITARSLSVDSLLTNAIDRAGPEKAREILGLPRHKCLPAVTLLLGYSRDRNSMPRGRLGEPGVVHRGRYRDLDADGLAELVADYDDDHRRLAMDVDWRAQGHGHYLDWYFKCWRDRHDTEKAAECRRVLGDYGIDA